MQVNKQMPITTFEYAAGIPLEKTSVFMGDSTRPQVQEGFSVVLKK